MSFGFWLIGSSADCALRFFGDQRPSARPTLSRSLGQIEQTMDVKMIFKI